MKTINPDKLGLSKDKLMAMENFFKEKYIKNGKLAGIQTLIAIAKVKINSPKIIQPRINPAGKLIASNKMYIIGFTIKKEMIVFLYQLGAAPKKL